MNITLNNLINSFTESLLEIRSKTEGREQLSSISTIVDSVMAGFSKFLLAEGFARQEEEIEFFKSVKPKILAIKIEEAFRYSLISNKPIGTVETQRSYFEEELKSLNSYFRLNPFYYQYYLNKYSGLDSQFFLRTSGSLPIPVTDIIPNAQGFNPPMSYLFAKFIAFENIQYYILEQITALQNPLKSPGSNELSANDMKWTGDSINIVELAYGLWLTGQLNNGNASLNQIVRWLESNLQVSLGIVQRRFDEISRRKRLSPTKYLDQMRDQVVKKIEDNQD